VANLQAASALLKISGCFGLTFGALCGAVISAGQRLCAEYRRLAAARHCISYVPGTALAFCKGPRGPVYQPMPPRSAVKKCTEHYLIHSRQDVRNPRAV
jgi:hypothetical protein